MEVAAPPVGGTTTPLQGPAPPAGGPNSVSGVCSVSLVAWGANDAAHQAWTARVMWMFAGRATGSLRDWPATGLRWYRQSGPGRTDHRGRLLLRTHGDEELLGQLLDQILTISPPSWRAKDVGGKRHLWDHEDPFFGCGARDCEKSRISSQHKDRLPRFGPRGCVKP